MPNQATILLSAQDPDLLAALQRARPDMRALPIGPDIPDAHIEGPLWCFVDWLLPEISGLEMVRRLHADDRTRESHITMVLESNEPEDRRRALRAGADDYLVGPLDAGQIVRRLEQSVPSQQATLPKRGCLRHGEMTLDTAAYQVRYRGELVRLRPNEFQLFVHFLENPDRLFTRSNLIERIKTDGHAIDARTVDVWIGRLRRALGASGVPDPIRTVHSLGYVLDSLPDQGFSADRIAIASDRDGAEHDQH